MPINRVGDCADGVALALMRMPLHSACCSLMHAMRGTGNTALHAVPDQRLVPDAAVPVQLAYHSDWCSRDYVKRGTCDATCKRCTPCNNSAVSPPALPAGGPSSAPGSPGAGIPGTAPGPAPSSGPDSGSPSSSTGVTGVSGSAPGPAPAGSPGPSGAIPGGIVKVVPGNSSSYCLAEIKVSPVDATIWTDVVIQCANIFELLSSDPHKHLLLPMVSKSASLLDVRHATLLA